MRYERWHSYTYANNIKAEIYYILINKKLINSALNCEAHSSFDHRIVSTKILLSLRRNTMQTTQTTLCDWFLLNNRDIRNNTKKQIRCSSGDIRNTPNDEYENFANAHLEIAAECILTKLRAKIEFRGNETTRKQIIIVNNYNYILLTIIIIGHFNDNNKSITIHQVFQENWYPFVIYLLDQFSFKLISSFNSMC